MSTNHGNRFRIVENSSYIYRSENLTRRPRTAIYLSNVRKILCCWNCLVEYGHYVGGDAGNEIIEACCTVLSPHE